MKYLIVAFLVQICLANTSDFPGYETLQEGLTQDVPKEQNIQKEKYDSRILNLLSNNNQQSPSLIQVVQSIFDIRKLEQLPEKIEQLSDQFGQIIIDLGKVISPLKLDLPFVQNSNQSAKQQSTEYVQVSWTKN